MRLSVLLTAACLASVAAPAWATPCGTHIATIERRLESSGATKVTGDKPNPAAESGSNKTIGQAPAAANPTQAPSADKIEQARGLIAEAKKKDQAGDAAGCETTMTEATKMIGALP